MVGQQTAQIGQMEMNAGRNDLQQGEMLKQLAMREIATGNKVQGQRDLAAAQMMINRGQTEMMMGQRDQMLGQTEMQMGRR